MTTRVVNPITMCSNLLDGGGDILKNSSWEVANVLTAGLYPSNLVLVAAGKLAETSPLSESELWLLRSCVCAVTSLVPRSEQVH